MSRRCGEVCCGCFCFFLIMYIVYFLFGYVLSILGLASWPFSYIFWLAWKIIRFLAIFFIYRVVPYGFIIFLCYLFYQNFFHEIVKLSKIRKEVNHLQQNPVISYYVDRFSIMSKPIFIGYAFSISLRMATYFFFSDEILMEIISYANIAVFMSILMIKKESNDHYHPLRDNNYASFFLMNFILIFVSFFVVDDFIHIFTGNSILFS